jgi:hypothetical protein
MVLGSVSLPDSVAAHPIVDSIRNNPANKQGNVCLLLTNIHSQKQDSEM